MIITIKKYLANNSVITYHLRIDEEDYQKIIGYKIYVTKCGKRGAEYPAITHKGKLAYLHRFLFNPDKNLIIDHIDRDPFNLERSNIRQCTRTENNRNRGKQKRKCSSVYKGVCWNKIYKKWQVEITVNRKAVGLGYYDNELEAALAYNKAAQEHFGEFAVLNVV